MRIQAIRRAWAAMGSFWTKKGTGFKLKRIIFQSKIWSIALSGLEAFIVKKSYLAPIETVVCKCGSCV